LNVKTTRKKDDFLDLLTEKIQDNPDYRLPEGYKKILVQVPDVVYEVNEKVADVFNISEDKKVCLEVLDGIIFKLLGSHFLEPTSKSKMAV
jgi:hypothetical protein